MNIREAVQNIYSNPAADRRDVSMAKNLLAAQEWKSVHTSYAKTMAKKYKLDIAEEFPGRRAVLREEKIYCFGNLYGNSLAKFKAIPGLIEWKDTKNVPVNNYSIKILRELNFNFSENLKAWEEENKVKEKQSKGLNLPTGLSLRPFQTDGWRRIEELDGRVLLADQPRIGKTIQSIAYLINHPELRPALIVVPASIKIQWQREINKWLPGEKCKIINGKKDTVPNTGITVINYDILFHYFCLLETTKFKVVIGDEIHKIKHESSQRSKAFRYLSSGIPHIIAISGTPTERPSEFFTVLNIIAPTIFNSRTKYLERYANFNRQPDGKGHSHIEELNNILKSTFMIRRLRSEVWQDIPEKERIIVPVEIDNRAEYQEAERDLIAYLRETKGNRAAQNAIRSQALARFNTLKQIAARGKLKAAKEWVEDYTENEKIVCFAIHREIVENLNNHFSGSSVKYYGGMSAKEKDSAIKKFNEDSNTTAFFANLLSAGVGLPLHVADATITFELGWNFSDHFQAEDRVINESKFHVPIAAYYMIATGTIEETIASMIDAKSKVLSTMLDGKEAEADTLLTVLIEKYSNL